MSNEIFLTTHKIKGARPMAINTVTREIVYLIDGAVCAKKDYQRLTQHDRIDFDEGEMIVLPTQKRADRIFLSGTTGAGKSTSIAKYLNEYKKIRPSQKIILFSDAPQDTILDAYEPIRIKLNKALVENPIHTSELANTLCIFDDIDSISDKSIKKAVLTLYDSILKKGSSKDNIQLIVTSHQMNDYGATRNILLNSNYIVFYPRAPMGVAMGLAKYGLSKPQISFLLSLPSRAVWLHTNYPFIVTTDKSVILLS